MSQTILSSVQTILKQLNLLLKETQDQEIVDQPALSNALSVLEN